MAWIDERTFGWARRAAVAARAVALSGFLVACPQSAVDGGNDPAAATDSGSGASDASGSDTTTTRSGDDAPDSTAEADAGSDGSTGGDPDPLQGDLFLARAAGLWAAPVTTDSSVGDFPLMNMDVRAVGDRTLFSRVDLDGDNNLRFAFSYEVHPELGRILVYRNGGFFQGFLRDTRTQLVEYDEAADTWRFCAIDGGCMYIDAHFQLTDAGAMDLDVAVLGMHHIHWAPSRVEDRALEAGFPGAGSGTPTDPFLPMPTLEATVHFTNPADDGEEAWLILFAEPCPLMVGQCNPSRFYRAVLQAGQTEVTLPIDQIHAGDYFTLAVLDRDANLGGTLLPGPGDAVSIPNQELTVAAEGTSTADIMVMVEL